jgi:hypothetical protein
MEQHKPAWTAQVRKSTTRHGPKYAKLGHVLKMVTADAEGRMHKLGPEWWSRRWTLCGLQSYLEREAAQNSEIIP